MADLAIAASGRSGEAVIAALDTVVNVCKGSEVARDGKLLFAPVQNHQVEAKKRSFKTKPNIRFFSQSPLHDAGASRR